MSGQLSISTFVNMDQMTPTPLVVFNMRDRLYAVICSSDMIDQIMGWSSGKLGEEYAKGVFGKCSIGQRKYNCF